MHLHKTWSVQCPAFRPKPAWLKTNYNIQRYLDGPATPLELNLLFFHARDVIQVHVVSMVMKVFRVSDVCEYVGQIVVDGVIIVLGLTRLPCSVDGTHAN